MHTRASKTALARRVWIRMFEFLIRTGPERAAILARYGLTPNDSRALSSLDTDGARTMRSLADEWRCDASNATLIVDRLEELRLARRSTAERDRRLKLVTLTPKGARLKTRLRQEFHAPPTDLLTLTRPQLDALERALRSLPR